MPFDEKLACDFLERIAFERLGGSPSEGKAVKLICRAVQAAGAVPKVETFPIRTFTKGVAGVEVLAPYRKRYPAKPVALTGRFPKGGKVLPLVHIAAMSPVALANARGKAIYGYGSYGHEQMEMMRKAGVAALLRIADHGKSMGYGRLGDRARRRFGCTPTLTIPYEAGLEMVRRGASKARIHLEQGERKALSRNVIAVVKGTCPALAEEIVVCGHHDSVPDSPGANDNGGGAAILVGLLKRLAAHPTRRTLRFIWFGSEEQGLLGSEAYVKAHGKDLGNVRMVVNVDGAGRLIDASYAVTAGPDGLKQFVDTLGKERGMGLQVTEGAFGSDSIPFSWHEIPAINITRGADKNFFVHTENDGFQWCGAGGLAANGELALEIIRRLGDARQFPFPRGFTEAVRKSLKGYYDNMLLSSDEMPKWCRPSG